MAVTPIRDDIRARIRFRADRNPKESIIETVQFIKRLILKDSGNGVVLKVSNDLSSVLCGRLCQVAVEQLRAEGTNDARFVAVRIRNAPEEEDDDAIIDFIKPDEVVKANTADTVRALLDSGPNIVDDVAVMNMHSRISSTLTYGIANERKLLVCGAENSVGYVAGISAKFGEGACDFMPIMSYTNSQCLEMLHELRIPSECLNVIHSGNSSLGLPEKNAQTLLNFTNDDVNSYIEGKKLPPVVVELIEANFIATDHKRHLPIKMSDTWWTSQESL